MNNLSSYCGLVDGKIGASDKDLPVLGFLFNLSHDGVINSWSTLFSHTSHVHLQLTAYFLLVKMYVRIPKDFDPIALRNCKGHIDILFSRNLSNLLITSKG